MGKKRKRLAILVGQADESFQSRFISGFTKQAFELGRDVCVFSMYKKYQDTVDREMGESNIFSLLNPDFFDGILIMKDTIQTAGLAEQIEEQLHNSYDGPVLIVDLDSKYYKSIFIDCYTPILRLTNHLIEDHSVKDIAFLTGKKRHRHSLQRLAGFKESMKRHGLSVPKDRIIEGDFWYLSGEQCVETLMAQDKKLPEAIVCANDQMAIGVCKAFHEKGVRVPEDILVVGADSVEEGLTSPKIVTSYKSPAFELGGYAVTVLRAMKNGNEIPEFDTDAELIYGETCGCNKMTESGINIRRKDWHTEISEEGFDSINNVIFENLMIQNDVLDYIGTVYSYAYQIKGAESFHLCLVKEILNLGEKEVRRNDGYGSEMVYAIRYSKDQLGDMVSLDETFDRKLMLPELNEYRSRPRAFFFTPVFFEDRCYGYGVVSYGDTPRSYDDVYRRWIKAISFGFENLSKNMQVKNLTEEVKQVKSSKFDKIDAMYDNLSPEEKNDYTLVNDIIDNNLFNYHFQPIVRAKDGTIFSYEALMRSKTERRVSPLTILKYASMQDRFPEIESATFNNVLDIIGKSKENIGDAKIFINSIPGVKVDDLEEVTKKLKACHDNVVVELTEESELDDSNLERLKEYFANLDIDVAVDDYGTGYSNISNLLRYMPNYVKIDRSLLSEIQDKPQKQHFVREIIDFCHNNDIMALAEGVETSEELSQVIHLGADLIQGFYTGRPSPEFVGRIDDKIINEIKTYYQERMDGRVKNVYIAGKTNRVALISLAKDGYSDIVIGKGDMVYNDITIIGLPSMKTDMHLRIEAGYSGRIILENVCFSNIKNRPCIELGENSVVTLQLEGTNVLYNTGIMVPDSAEFTLEGSGSLKIELTNQEFYGIGNDAASKHGNITFNKDGNLTITANGTKGTYVGSGLGGRIEVSGGSYNIEGNTTEGVVFGALYEESNVSIEKCGIEMDLSGTKVVAVGSLEKKSSVQIQDCSLKCLIDGREVVGIGTLLGESSFVKVYNSLVDVSVNADMCTALGALKGATELDISMASVRVTNAGADALAFGGKEADTHISLIGVDTRVKVYNTTGVETYAKDENITIENGRCKIVVNDTEIERELIFRF
ncbi:EAL domain, c-di-GMP-specific phosphodiesterase class I (or its enzymatically inactive variant) [Lachnospiraceae bacterium NE2001]|nr:EAL domain, c-di-GMP-specific phosphodiesterase class I (or its enzymatically inactive variant) [Lachnospiraceae bacterium NE2001]